MLRWTLCFALKVLSFLTREVFDTLDDSKFPCLKIEQKNLPESMSRQVKERRINAIPPRVSNNSGQNDVTAKTKASVWFSMNNLKNRDGEDETGEVSVGGFILLDRYTMHGRSDDAESKAEIAK